MSKQKLIAWWNRIEEGDRRALSLLIVFCSIIAAYLGAWKPAKQSLQSAKAEYRLRAGEFEWMKGQSHKVSTLVRGKDSQPPGREQAPLLTLVEESAKEKHIALDKITAQTAGQLQVHIADIDFLLLVSWLNTLHADHNISVSNAMISRRKAAGSVSASIDLRK